MRRQFPREPQRGGGWRGGCTVGDCAHAFILSLRLDRDSARDVLADREPPREARLTRARARQPRLPGGFAVSEDVSRAVTIQAERKDERVRAVAYGASAAPSASALGLSRKLPAHLAQLRRRARQ